MGAVRTSSKPDNSYLAYLERLALNRGTNNTTIKLLAGVSDPYHSTADLVPTDNSGDNLIPLDVLISRFAAKSTFTAGNVTCYQVDSLDFVQKNPGLGAFTGYKYSATNPQILGIPSECALWVRFPGSAGIVQSKGTSPGTRSLVISSGAPNNHGAVFVSGLWLMGDPTLSAGTADAFEFLNLASVFDAWLWDCRILGYLGASRVFDITGVTQFHARGLHYSNCGTSAGATNSLMYINGNEFGVQVEDIEFNAVSPPPNVPVPADKATATSIGIYRDFTGNVMAMGDVWKNIQGGDPLAALLVIAPTSSGFVGPQTLINVGPGGNVCGAGAGGVPAVLFDGTNGTIRGGIWIEGGETHLNGVGGSWQFKNLTCPIKIIHHRMDQLGQTFSFDFTGTTGEVMIEECTTDTAGVRVPVTNNATGLVRERFGNVSSRYYTSTLAVAANLAVGWDAGGQVKVLPTSSDPAALVGIVQQAIGAAGSGPVSEPGQVVTISADATVGGIAANGLFKPSALSAGKFITTSASPASGTVQAAIGASATGLALVR